MKAKRVAYWCRMHYTYMPVCMHASATSHADTCKAMFTLLAYETLVHSQSGINTPSAACRGCRLFRLC